VTIERNLWKITIPIGHHLLIETPGQHDHHQPAPPQSTSAAVDANRRAIRTEAVRPPIPIGSASTVRVAVQPLTIPVSAHLRGSALYGNVVRERCLLTDYIETGKHEHFAVRIGFQLAVGVNDLVERQASGSGGRSNAQTANLPGGRLTLRVREP
jgi:hypothetical protein